MNEVPENYVMPEPPYVEGINWDDWTPVDKRLTAAEELDLKCSEVDELNRYYR